MKKDFNKKLIDRLSRAEGQVRALRESVESGREPVCKEFLSQIKAARTALKGAGEQYVLHHINTCHNLPKKKRAEQISDVIKILSRD